MTSWQDEVCENGIVNEGSICVYALSVAWFN